MPGLHVRLFGKFAVQIDSCAPPNLDARKVQELFCYLLLHRDHTHSREVLAGLLWGESSTAQAKKCLRQTLWQMQTALGLQSTPDRDRVLRIEADWVHVNTRADLWLDIAEFERAFSLVQGQRGEELDDPSVQALRRAVDLYTGDLLEGWYQDWCIYERERLQTIYLALLDKLMAHCETHQEYEAGLAYAARVLRYDRAHEQTHRRLMSLYYLAGDRAAALRQYKRCVAALQEELGVQPARRTTALYERIQADQYDHGPAQAAGARLPPSQGSVSLHGLIGRLKQRWHTLIDIERQMREDIESLEVAIQNQGESSRQP
jgi:DNA-binding SARP family transcriptional activator